MGIRICYIKPSAYAELNGEIQSYLESYAEPGTEVSVVSVQKGPRHMEYLYYQHMAAQAILYEVKRAEKEGFDGAVIGCFDDPCLLAAREICDRMVVTGPGESAMQLAAQLGDTFSVIIGRDKWIPQMRDNVRRYGHADRLASFRSLGLGVPEFHADPERTRRRMREEIEAAIREDGAEVILLGCTMEFGFYREMQAAFGVPVIDVMLAAFKQAEYLAGLKARTGWFTSRIRAFAPPPVEEIRGWNLPEDFALGNIWD